jgi:hypothetical protein
MTKSRCFVLQYNTEALVLVLQYYFGKRAKLKQYQTNLSDQIMCPDHADISDGATKEIEVRRVLNKASIVHPCRSHQLCFWLKLGCVNWNVSPSGVRAPAQRSGHYTRHYFDPKKMLTPKYVYLKKC